MKAGILSSPVNAANLFSRYVRARWRVRNDRWARTIARKWPVEDFDRPVNGGRGVTFKALNVTAPLPAAEMLMTWYPLAVELVERAGCVFSVDSNDQLTAQVREVIYPIGTPEEVFILHELHVRRVYPLQISGPTLVLDIGMNAGFASLYFAAAGPEVRVWAFEPFAETYRAALANISRNASLAARITPHQCALGIAQGEANWEYLPSQRGSCGQFGVHLASHPQARREPVKIRPASAVVEEARGSFSRHTLVAKIDCEGGEYDILSSLAQSKLLGAIDCYMVEWHRCGGLDPRRLVAQFTEHGFLVLAPTDPAGGDADGLIYAFRRASA